MFNFFLTIVFHFGFLYPETTVVDIPKNIPSDPLVSELRIDRPTEKKISLNPANISASGAILMNRYTGEVLFEKAADAKRPMASLTKLMTAIVSIDMGHVNDTIVVPELIDDTIGSTVGLRPGNHFSRGQLLFALLVNSANDAALTLASESGSLPTFIKKMNTRARSLGLHNTHFDNPAGLDSPNHFSTPRDMAFLAKSAIENPYIRAIVDTKEESIQSAEGTSIALKNTNDLLHIDPRVHGMKTGTTYGAGECLVLLFTEESEEYILVLFESNQRYTDALMVMNAMDAQ